MVLGVNFGKALPQQSVAAHRHPNPGLAELVHQQRTRDGNDRTHRDDARHEIHVDALEDKRQRVIHI